MANELDGATSVTLVLDAGLRPLAIDLFCGLGGWTDGLLAEGWLVVGFDIERHEYGDAKYPAQLVLQDVLTLHGSQFKEADLIVASPPCQGYSYRAMPWSRAKALPPPDNSLFEACFRIQREACEAAGRHIPLIVENVRGAQKWVGRSRWNYGSFHLWGDVPALMPLERGRKNTGGSWFNVANNTTSGKGQNPDGRLDEGVKGFTPNGERLGQNVLGRKHGSKSKKRKEMSARIAKIPLPLSRYIAATFRPLEERAAA